MYRFRQHTCSSRAASLSCYGSWQVGVPSTNSYGFRPLILTAVAAGPFTYDDEAIIFEGEAFRFNGQQLARKAVYRRDVGNLVVEVTDTVDGNPDTQRIVLARAQTLPATKTTQVAKTTPAENLAEELQGTWKLEQANGRWTEKTITGLTGKLTRYDADGNVTHAHGIRV